MRHENTADGCFIVSGEKRLRKAQGSPKSDDTKNRAVPEKRRFSSVLLCIDLSDIVTDTEACTDTGGDLFASVDVCVGNRAANYGENDFGNVFCHFACEFYNAGEGVFSESGMTKLRICIGIGGIETD